LIGATVATVERDVASRTSGGSAIAAIEAIVQVAYGVPECGHALAGAADAVADALAWVCHEVIEAVRNAVGGILSPIDGAIDVGHPADCASDAVVGTIPGA
jgi:hypothetical protein